jgi:hypothetical protein
LPPKQTTTRRSSTDSDDGNTKSAGGSLVDGTWKGPRPAEDGRTRPKKLEEDGLLMGGVAADQRLLDSVDVAYHLAAY